MNPWRGLRIALAFSLLVPLLTAQGPQRRQGDWVVTGAETVENASILLSGNLVIQGTGSLTLNNVTLTLDRKSDGVYGIEARPGATFIINNCNFAPVEANARFSFLVDGARFQMRRSRVEGLAFLEGDYGGGGLIVANATGAVLEDNTITHPYTYGVQFKKSQNGTVRRNLFLGRASDWHGATGMNLTDSHGNLITANRLSHAGVCLQGSFNNQVTDNEVTLPAGFGIFLFGRSGYNTVSGNRFTWDPSALPSCFAIRLVGTPHPNYILNNTVTGPRYAILISYSANTVVAGNKGSQMADAYTGAIHVYRSQNIQLLNNEITDSGNGIMLFASPRNQIRGNRVSGSAYGVMLVESNQNTVAGNVFSKNRDNLQVIDSSDNVFEENNFYRGSRQAWDEGANTWRNNYWDDAPGQEGPYAIPSAGLDSTPKRAPNAAPSAPVPTPTTGTPPAAPKPQPEVIGKDTVWENCEKEIQSDIGIPPGAKLTIRNCKLRMGSGFTWMGGIGFTVPAGATLEILNSTLAGDGLTTPFEFKTFAGSKLVIRDSTIRYAGTWAGGIEIAGDGAVIENNEITGNYEGLRIYASRGHRIAGNRISSTYRGIFFSGGPVEAVTVENNVFTKCLFNGIYAPMVVGSRFVGNRVEGSWQEGMKFDPGSSGNLIRGNVFAGNASGLGLLGKDNVVYDNAFLGNGVFYIAPFGRGQAGIWAGNRLQEGGRGNYWSDYRGQDLNGDGIGDVPHEVGPGVLDLYPLISPSAWEKCSYVISPPELWLAGAGGTGSVEVNARSACAWAAASQSSWLRIDSGAAGVGRGRAAFQVAANTEARFRVGSLLVAGQTVRVIQSPAGCTYSIDPQNLAVGAGRATASVKVSANAGCPWTAAGEAPWLEVTSGAVGVGSGEVSFTVQANVVGARAGALRVAGHSHLVVQEAAGAVFMRDSIVNAASGVNTGGLAPGTFTSIFGTRLGPPVGVAVTVPQRGLAGTRVFFEGVEGFLTYASWNQVNLLVPNGLAPGTPMRVQIESQGRSGDRHPLTIAPASPGIFTMDGSGIGQAVVVNQDGSFNSAKAPATRGSIVTFFATGCGVTDPPSVDGVPPVPPAFPEPVLPFSVVVNQQVLPAENVLFAGLVYAGVFQMNVRLPDGLPSGDKLELVLRFECGEGKTCDSRPGVTLAVQ